MSECFDAVVDGCVGVRARDDAYGGDGVPRGDEEDVSALVIVGLPDTDKFDCDW